VNFDNGREMSERERERGGGGGGEERFSRSDNSARRIVLLRLLFLFSDDDENDDDPPLSRSLSCFAIVNTQRARHRVLFCTGVVSAAVAQH